MKDKKEIGLGVVYDHNEMRNICHRLRVIESALDSFINSEGTYTDGSDAVFGMQILLVDIIKWLAPDDAATEEERLKQKPPQQQIASVPAPKQTAAEIERN